MANCTSMIRLFRCFLPVLAAGLAGVCLVGFVIDARRAAVAGWGVRLLSAAGQTAARDRDAAPGAGWGADAGAGPLLPARPSLRVLTFNIRHGAVDGGGVDLAAVATVIRESGAEVVALQEVDRFQGRSGLVDQARWLAGELGMDYVFGPAMRRGLGQYGNALLSRHPIVASRNVALPAELEPRSAIIARVATPAGEVTVVATHLGLSARDRASQAAAVLEEVAKEPEPQILLGDWDAEAGAPELAPLRDRFRSTLEEAGVFPAYTFRGGAAAPYVSIDHIFLSSGVFVTDAQVMPHLVSDHLPVVAEVWLPPRRRG